MGCVIIVLIVMTINFVGQPCVVPSLSSFWGWLNRNWPYCWLLPNSLLSSAVLPFGLPATLLLLLLPSTLCIWSEQSIYLYSHCICSGNSNFHYFPSFQSTPLQKSGCIQVALEVFLLRNHEAPMGIFQEQGSLFRKCLPFYLQLFN